MYINLHEEPIDDIEPIGVCIFRAEDGNQVDSICTDFSKAFDRVRHQLLLNEMSVVIEPARCMWLISYLSGRIQKIIIGEAVS
jgi:hypothetical protein